MLMPTVMRERAVVYVVGPIPGRSWKIGASGEHPVHPSIKRLLTTSCSDATGHSTKSVITRGGQLPTLNNPAEYALDTSSDLLAALRFLISALT